MEELLKQIGIDDEPTEITEDKLIIDIPDSDTFGKYYSKLEKTNVVKPDLDSSQLSPFASSLQYINDDVTITLTSDFQADTYKLVIREN